MSRNSRKSGKAFCISINMSSCLTAEDSSRTLLEPFPPFSHERNRSCPSPSGSPQTGPILILIFLALLLEDCCASSSWHSLYYSYTFVSKPSQGLPEFSILESIDDQPIAHYDSHTKEYRSLVPWMEQVKKEEPLWKEYTEIAKKAEQGFGRNLVTLKKYYNHSEGFHTLQWRYGCELRYDWPRGGSDQDSYDGRTFISFDKETLSWTAIDTAAQLSKRKLEGNPSVAKHIKYYLEETCIEMLRRRITYGKEALLRKEPTVTVTSKAEASQTETHICRMDGFFPKDIKATWRKDGEIWLQDTLHGLVAPNSDGTYHFWLRIRINPGERNHFQCHVEHDSLKSPLKVVLMAPALHPVSIIISVLAAIVMALATGWCTCLVVHIQIQTSQASPDERSFNIGYRIFIFVGLLLLILAFIGLQYFFELILGSILLRFIFFGVFLSCCLLEIVGCSVWIRLKKRNIRPLSSGQNAIASENHQASSNSGRSNLEEIPLQPIVFNNTAGEENQREDLQS